MINFVPEYMFQTFDEATPEFLVSIGVKGVVLDIDNTLEPYENATPSKRVIDWLNAMKSNGIKAAIVSNNCRERVEVFNADIGIPSYFKAKKPFKNNVINAMNDLGTNTENTILMGDQVFTDVWAAHNAKIRAILVPPIKDRRDLFTRFKRFLERFVINKYNRLQKKSEKLH